MRINPTVSTCFRRLLACAFAGALPLLASGCMIGQAFSAAAYYAERDKKIEVLAQYSGLDDASVAVLVQADMSTLYETPMVAPNITANVAQRIQSNVPGVRVRDAREVMAWQYQTPGWWTLPYSEVARQLDVDRVVFIDLYEYRLNPPGNRWMWEGVAAANIGVIERDGVDSDSFAENFNVVAKFPIEDNLGRDNASESAVTTGLLVRFIDEAAGLFYTHIEKKYPDG